MGQFNFNCLFIAFLCFTGIATYAQGEQEICIGDIKSYSVTETPGSTYSWDVEPAAFSGTITETTPSGNQIEIDWQDSPVGQYILTVIETNSEGCPGEPVKAIININPLPDAPVVEVTHPDCGEEFGSAEITSPLGADLQYSLDGGANFQSSVIFANLNPGTYEVIARDALGCTSEPTEFIINDPLVIPETPVVEVTQPECGETTGAIEITSPTGTGLQYSIDGGTTFSTDPVFADLEPGEYQVLVTNGDCESEIVAVTIDPAPEVPADPEFTIINPDCGETEGILTITLPLGAELEYSVDGGVTWQTDPEFILAPGDYQVLVRNINSTCTSGTVGATIEEAPETPVTSPIQFN